MTEMDQRIGRNIRQIMDESGVRHACLAEALGMSSAEMSRIVSGKRALRALLILRTVQIARGIAEFLRK